MVDLSIVMLVHQTNSEDRQKAAGKMLSRFDDQSTGLSWVLQKNMGHTKGWRSENTILAG